MPSKKTELTDEQAQKAKAALERLRSDAGKSAAKLASYLTLVTGEEVAVPTVSRWIKKDGRPTLEAWRLLVAAGAIADDGSLPVLPHRGKTLDADDVAELSALSRRLSRIVARLG